MDFHSTVIKTEIVAESSRIGQDGVEVDVVPGGGTHSMRFNCSCCRRHMEAPGSFERISANEVAIMWPSYDFASGCLDV